MPEDAVGPDETEEEDTDYAVPDMRYKEIFAEEAEGEEDRRES